MLADPPELIGQRVRFLVTVLNQMGGVERARARVWTDGNIEVFRGLGTEESKIVARGFIRDLADAVASGDMELIPNMRK